MNHQEFEKIASQLSDLTNYPKGYVPNINKQYYRTKRLQQEMQSKRPNSQWHWIAASIFFVAVTIIFFEFNSSSSISKVAFSNKKSNKSAVKEDLTNSEKQAEMAENRNIGRLNPGIEHRLSDTLTNIQKQDTIIAQKVVPALALLKSKDTVVEKLSPKWVSQLKKQRKYNIISIAPEAYNPQPKLHNRNFDFFVLGDRGFELIKRLPQKEETILYPNRDN